MTLANKEVGGVQKICAVFGYRALEKINKDKSPDVKYHYFRIVIEIFYGITNLCQSIKRIFFSEIVVLNNRETRQLGYEQTFLNAYFHKFIHSLKYRSY